MIEQSQLEPIIKIRMNESAKMELKTELAKMVDKVTLDEGKKKQNKFCVEIEIRLVLVLTFVIVNNDPDLYSNIGPI